ncbi:hypothetical protein CMI42_04205, partial [Candidatus Pacearchaeota archaeon]|nr:hypothetical protein [Candidatus Pacearchaeota archaeon]
MEEEYPKREEQPVSTPDYDQLERERHNADFITKEDHPPHFHEPQNPDQKGFQSPQLRLDKNAELAEIDKELEELLQKQHAKVKVFGLGGAGGNTISRMKEIGIKGGEFIALNTDAQDLLYANSDHK